MALTDPFPPADPRVINLVSATPDGPRAVVLLFDRPPAGAVLDSDSYTITPAAGADPLDVSGVALEPAPEGHVYPLACRLTFARGGTAGEDYSVRVAGILGPSDEPLSGDTATWTAPDPTAVRVIDAFALGFAATIIEADQDLDDDAALRDPANYSIATPGRPPIEPATASLDSARAIRLTHEALDPSTTYTVTVASGEVRSLDGATIDSPGNVAVYVTSAAPVAWTPTAPRVTLDGMPLEPFGLLPEPGEPEVAAYIRAAWLSLLTDAPAQEGDALPDEHGNPPYRGGWWGDAHATMPGDVWGSRWWLLRRTRDPDAAAKAAEWGDQALAWMVTDGILTAAPTITAAVNGARLDVSVRLSFADHLADLAVDLWGGQ